MPRLRCSSKIRNSFAGPSCMLNELKS
jgi:hypothetical protein